MTSFLRYSSGRLKSRSSKALGQVLADLGISSGGGGGGDGVVLVVLDTLSSPPGAPNADDAYLVGCGASGAWAGQEGKIATWNGSAWIFTTPTGSNLILDASDGKIYTRNSSLGFAKTYDVLTTHDNNSFWGPPVINTATAPPGSPSDGDRYLVIATATGAFSGQENKIATYYCGNWHFQTPVNGQMIWNENTDQFITYTSGGGGGWVDPVGALGPFDIDYITAGDILISDDGVNFTNRPLTLDDVSDINFTGIGDQKMLVYDQDSDTYIFVDQPSGGGGGVTSLPDLDDVSFSGSISDGQLLAGSGGVFVKRNMLSITELTNVSWGGGSFGQVLMYTGSAFRTKFSVGSAEAIGLVRGRVLAAGAIAAGTGFSVTKLGTGDYRLDFSAGILGGTPVGVACLSGTDTSANNATVWLHSATTTSARVRILTGSASPVDHDFSFIVMGGIGAIS